MTNIGNVHTSRQFGEETRTQLKERIIDKYDIGCELVALNVLFLTAWMYNS